ncbi:methyltransferase [Fictibacillus macauensis ZFHKF-1]|uniref:Methyltransferase n=1 Tax=Fictibacillus macauensis ZFHKF-1 TaxID=1196324 RepID=I8AH75_9BACL|nr:methyltransferase [Fictibacillus macauensis ZFHKF-1]
MRKETIVTVKTAPVSPLLTADLMINGGKGLQEGTLLKLIDQRGKFVGKGYVGQQNKGMGWLLTSNEKETINVSFFREKLKQALEQRTSLFNDSLTTAFRVFNGEGDGIGGLTIDYFDGYYVFNWYSEGIYDFKEEVLEAFRKVTTAKGIYEKKRFAEKGSYIEDDDFVEGERAQFPLIVQENGMFFATYLNESAMVGIFLDQRHVRKAIRDKYAANKRVLNTFSYTGAFSVAAALGGAKKTTSVDLANRSRSKTEEQFSINGIDPASQEIIVEDVFHYFKYAVRKQLLFDLVILDPPSFARSKKHTFSAAKDYTALLTEAIAITEQGGVIVASSNCSTFSMKKFKGFIDQAFKRQGFKYQVLEEHTLPEDFKTINNYKEGNYLKVVIVKKI